MTTLAEIEAALVERGLAPRGAFHPDRDDAAPAGARTVVLAGQVGASHWERFEQERRDEPDPLDRWAARALGDVAEQFGARVILPGDGPPRPPFQRWAMRAESVHPSPLGLLIHPEYGLWHAYRGALSFEESIALPPRVEAPSPCDTCSDRPCMRTCPIGAFSKDGFDADACAHHLHGRGDACFAVACLARAACPVARAYRYSPDPARFHLTAFVRGLSQS